MKKILFMYPFYIRWAKRILGRRAWFFLGAILALTFLSAFFIVLTQEVRDFIVKGFLKAFGTVLPFFLGEYGNLPEHSVMCTGISLLLFVIGSVVVVAIIGKVASIFVDLKMGVKMPEKLKSHIVICNWNDRGDKIIKEIHSPLAVPETEITVITDKDVNEAELRSSPRYENVYFCKSDPTLQDVLEKARIHLAKSVIILADSKSPDPDVKTAWISLAITNIRKHSEQKPRIIAEVINHQHIEHLKGAGVDECVCSADYGLGMIAQCALKARLSDVYQRLLEISEETNEIYLIDRDQYPEHFKGMTYKEVSRILNDKRNSKNPTILIGLKRDNIVRLNPREKEFNNIEDGDTLIVMAFKQPDLIRDFGRK
ncbi:MAG: NAD-binding protein [Candidatus Hodarchaeota archaeon]